MSFQMHSETQTLRFRNETHLLRKLWHIGMGSIGLFVYFKYKLTPSELSRATFILSILAFGFETIRLRSKTCNELVLKLMGPLMRESEKNSYSGLPFYSLGVSLAFAFYQEPIALLACLFLIFADPISSFVGILYGKDKLIPNKSVQGTAACFITCFILSILFCLMSFESWGEGLIVFAFLSALTGAAAELMSNYVDDNLAIPVLSGLGISIINLLIPIL